MLMIPLLAQYDINSSSNCARILGSNLCEQLHALTGAVMCHIERQERAFYHASHYNKGISREGRLSKEGDGT